MFFLAAGPVFAIRTEFDFTAENLSSGQNNRYYDLNLSDKVNDKTSWIGDITISDINGAGDATIAYGQRIRLDGRNYVYANAAFSPSHTTVPLLMLEGETGLEISEAALFVGYLRFQQYTESNVTTISPGLNYYFDFPGWLMMRYYLLSAVKQTVQNSWLIKYYHLIDPKFQVDFGLGSGNLASSRGRFEVNSYQSTTLLVGAKYSITGGAGLLADYSFEKRDNGVTDNLLTLGFFADWQ